MGKQGASRKTKKVFVAHDRSDVDANNVSHENHMDVFTRLSRVKNMHGKPGDRPVRSH